ncbi:hypothetical protein CEUSTIGMA_g9968.t1 [Chlamydomonas eustigma]|uniref:DUF4202 domain-containing protein n=1 Tax=Chlamydomonas eustigma TaxID=1157962 RepID=A0A250XHJ5_9CHLO|nr:hypothetical protein CEUSTIGMA_g9968.t1 [Chlamydomonas eustigma]|eukprot:GAX82541.1 hypothetical protein CEUSTIGMA_g9968.t1 [Chlamydomonas eustigma]
MAAQETSGNSRLKQVLDGIDEINGKDPRIIQVQGQDMPYELAYSKWLTDWVLKLTSGQEPSEELLIVARGQHVKRWTMPRNSYPDGRAPYLKWREDLKKLHSQTVVELMKEVGYSSESCKKVEAMMLKKSLKTDPDAQTVEDALCLVFLQYQFTDLRLKEPEDKMVDILQKTWKKMGEKGRAAALELAPNLCSEELALVQKALA